MPTFFEGSASRGMQFYGDTNLPYGHRRASLPGQEGRDVVSGARVEGVARSIGEIAGLDTANADGPAHLFNPDKPVEDL